MSDDGATPAAATAPKQHKRRNRRIVLGLALFVFLIEFPNPVEELFWGCLSPGRIDRSAAAPAQRRAVPRRVLLISLDGLPEPLFRELAPPTLRDLARDGRAASYAQIVSNSTLQSHGAMVSGVAPQRSGFTTHGYRPWSGFKVPTIFTVCGREGLRCALFVGKSKLAGIVANEPGCERYEVHRESVDELESALAYVRERDPDFVMIHIADIDAQGHRSGWGSPKQVARVGAVDAELGKFLVAVSNASPRPFAVLVTADHGGLGTRHGAERPEVQRVPWILWGDGIPPGSIPEHVSALDTAPTIVAMLGLDAPSEWEGKARVPK